METLNNKFTGANLPAAQWNQVPSELQNVITQTGQSLTNADLNQLGKGIAEYAGNGDFYTDSGGVNAYVLSVLGTKQAPTGYVDGLQIRFIPGNTNTSASTVNVASLGVKTIVNFNGVALTGAELTASDPAKAFFDLSNDRFQLLLEFGTNNYSLLKSGRHNFIINGEFLIWQRTLSTNATGYVADRWFNPNNNITISRVSSPFKGSEFALQALASGGVNPIIYHFIELQEIGDIAPFKTDTDYSLSFEIFDSSAGADIRVSLELMDGSGGANPVVVSPITTVGTTINGSQRIEFTFNFGNPTIIASNQALRLQVFLSTTDSVYILGRVQLEEGSNATAFEYEHISTTLELCQRYFEKSYDFTVAPRTATSTGMLALSVFSTNGGQSLRFRVNKRVTPTFAFFDSAGTSSGADVPLGTPGFGIALTISQVTETEVLFISAIGPVNRFIQYTADAEL